MGLRGWFRSTGEHQSTGRRRMQQLEWKSHQMVQKRRKGATKLGLQDVKDIAQAVGVPTFLFDLGQELHDLIYPDVEQVFYATGVTP